MLSVTNAPYSVMANLGIPSPTVHLGLLGMKMDDKKVLSVNIGCPSPKVSNENVNGA
jgi:hypothetical protein